MVEGIDRLSLYLQGLMASLLYTVWLRRLNTYGNSWTSDMIRVILALPPIHTPTICVGLPLDWDMHDYIVGGSGEKRSEGLKGDGAQTSHNKRRHSLCRVWR